MFMLWDDMQATGHVQECRPDMLWVESSEEPKKRRKYHLFIFLFCLIMITDFNTTLLYQWICCGHGKCAVFSKEEGRESMRTYGERKRRFSPAVVSAAAAQGVVPDHCVVQE